MVNTVRGVVVEPRVVDEAATFVVVEVGAGEVAETVVSGVTDVADSSVCILDNVVFAVAVV